MKIAIQGEAASFHDQAARQFFGASIQTVACDSFAEVFGVLNRHDAGAALVAIENSLYGSINQVYDLIESHGYPIVGEVHLPIRQQLIGWQKATITQVYSHPVALAQCENYLDSNFPNAERIEFSDTAGAVRFIKEQRNPSFAAIANRSAAELYGLEIIAENIEDNPANFTRFLAIKPNGAAPSNANRTSLVLTTSHVPGALAKILTILAELDINLSKLQSRPIIGEPWRYKFYLVLDTAGDQLNNALKSIKPLTSSLTNLGEYHSSALTS